jgi:hypothetical protein
MKKDLMPHALDMTHQALASRPPITDDLVDRVAVRADADRRTVIRALAGLPVRGRTGRRVAAAIEEVLGRVARRGGA